MKKAQWKQTPLQRLVHNKQVERIADLEEGLAMTRERWAVAEAARANLAQRIRTATEATAELRMYHTAYKFFRIVGVVLEYEGEFKHLKGADMDEFFGFGDTPSKHVAVADEQAVAAMYKIAAHMQAQHPRVLEEF